MDREPVVAGKFYTADKESLIDEVKKYLSLTTPLEKPSLVAMAPHAGYMYSGKIAGMTLNRANLLDTVILIGPNHTGYGRPISVWDKGRWFFPGGSLEVESNLADTIISSGPFFEKNYDAHKYEHSLEVMLPFLWVINPDIRIVPICVAEHDLKILVEAGKVLTKVIKSWNKPVSVVVSSDMSHFISHEEAKRKDKLAIDAIFEIDPEKLYKTVRKYDISMCGAMPMTIALSYAKEIGAKKAELVAYSTSAEVSGDYSYVVGYAGVVIY